MPTLNIILTGFMGTGKTSIGRLVAIRTGARFLDLDDLIAARAGKSISEIFAQDGEPAFRALEAAVCQEFREPTGTVIATGGGALLDPSNAEALGAGGHVICLEADPATIVTRLAGQDGRPLLAGPDRVGRIAALLAQRAGVYDALPYHLNTSQLSIASAAERVMAIAAALPTGGHRMPVACPPDGRGYDVLVAEGLLDEAGRRLLLAGLAPGRCAVVTNPTLGRLYAGRLVRSLEVAGFEPLVTEIPDGEEFKTLESAAQLYGQFAAARLARGEPVLALGGGVIGDLAGFAAATWLRGVPFVQIPTSLLAMVDASVGGKVAVDLPLGKNLVGAFKQPHLVLADPGLLGTLPPAEFRSGLAEVLKGALIGDPVLFEQLAGDGPRSLTGVIADAVRVKIQVVERDPFEAGERAWLNLGHTFGHALELESGFTMRHGEAVALGTVAAAEMSAALGFCEPGLPVRVRGATARLGLAVRHGFEPAGVYARMATDKKRAGRSLRFVLLKGVGQVTLADSAILAALETIRAA